MSAGNDSHVTTHHGLPEFETFGTAIGVASTALRANAMAAGLEAPVPTCPGWTVLDLVAHQGMVHRWAGATLRGEQVDPASLERAGRDSGDLLGWFDEGATALLQTLVDAPADVQAMTFLEDAPAPRLFWARRQAHETTVHAVDALVARLARSGATPGPAQLGWVSTELALDGIDELLTGFVPRGRGPRSATPQSWFVAPTGDERQWLVRTSPDSSATVERVRGEVGHDVDGSLRLPPVQAYLGLWNRFTPAPDEPMLAWWRTAMRVR